jgi:hypothetical protein
MDADVICISEAKRDEVPSNYSVIYLNCDRVKISAAFTVREVIY